MRREQNSGGSGTENPRAEKKWLTIRCPWNILTKIRGESESQRAPWILWDGSSGSDAEIPVENGENRTNPGILPGQLCFFASS